MEEELVVGDVVCLMSSSFPRMTVGNVNHYHGNNIHNNKNVHCFWFSGTELRDEWFNNRVLKICNCKVVDELDE